MERSIFYTRRAKVSSFKFQTSFVLGSDDPQPKNPNEEEGKEDQEEGAAEGEQEIEAKENEPDNAQVPKKILPDGMKRWE